MAMPLLRFKQDDGSYYPDWEKDSLKNCCDIIGGGTPSTSKNEYWNGNIQWFTPTEIKQKYVTNSDRTITELGLQKSSAKLLPAGTVLLTTRATLGKMSIATKECTTNQGFHSLIPNNRCINEFLYYLQPIVERYCLTHHSGTTFKETSKTMLEKCVIPLPCPEEQQKIADFLSDVDNQIENYQQSLDNLESQKKELLRQVFSQELRFKRDDGSDYSDWEEDVLGKYCDITTGKLNANAMNENGKYDFYTSGIKKYKIDNYAFEGPAITIAGNGATVGYLHIADGKFNAYQRTYVLTNFKCIRRYLYYIIGQELPKKIRKEVRPGVIPYIVLDMLTNLKIFLPCPEEQQKIADFFFDIENRIELERQRMQTMQELKKGLLQQMFC